MPNRKSTKRINYTLITLLCFFSVSSCRTENDNNTLLQFDIPHSIDSTLLIGKWNNVCIGTDNNGNRKLEKNEIELEKDNSSLIFHSKGLGVSLDRGKFLPFKWSVENDSIIWIQWPDWDAAYNVRALNNERLLLEVTEETEYDWLCFKKAIDQ